MYALTIWQPWASLLAHGIKAYETRAWAPPTDLLGDRIAIHAGRSRRGLDVYAGSCRPDDPACHRTAALQRLRCARGSLDDLPHGCIIATVRLAFAVRTDTGVGREVLAPERALGDWSPGRWAWRLVDPVLLRRPIPCPGRQRLWRLTGAQLLDLDEELRIAVGVVP